MKRIFFLIALLFTVVCYAAPPPDVVTAPIYTDVGCLVTADVNPIVAPIAFDAQEVAYNYIGNTMYTGVPVFAERIEHGANVPPVPVLTINYSTCSFMADLPMPHRAEQQPVYNFNRDMQFSNYSYPLSMN